MKKTIDYITSSILVLEGIVHIALTPKFFDLQNESAAIFIGMGLSFIFLGVINFIRILSNKKQITSICSICNSFCIGYFIYFLTLQTQFKMQLIVSAIIVIGTLILSIFQLIKKR